MILLTLLPLLILIAVSIHIGDSDDPAPFCSEETKAWVATSHHVKKSEVVVFVESTIESDNLVTRIIPGYRTWMKQFANVFVIVEDTFFTRFVMRHCKLINYNTPNVTEAHCSHEPTYVLSRNCGGTEGINAKEGQSSEATTCCKIDEMINHLVGNRHHLYNKTKYVLISDDDTMWRANQTMTWLNRIEEAGVGHFPMIASSKEFLDTNEHVYGIKNCREIVTNGFYQPTMLNKASINRLRAGHFARGFEQVCQSFQKYQDVGFGIWAWMYQLYTIFMPFPSHTLNKVSSLRPVDFTTHGLKGGCAEESKWPYDWRYDQTRVIGRGVLNQSCPKDDMSKLDMYEAWRYFTENGKDVNYDAHNYPQWCHRNVSLYSSDIINSTNGGKSGRRLVKRILEIGEIPSVEDVGDIELRLVPHLRRLPGYAETSHGGKHDIVQLYHPFTVEDCDPPGKLDLDYLG